MEILNHAEEKMKKAVAVLEEDLKTIRTGIAHASLLDHVQFEYYGSPTPINQVASVKVVEGRQLVIKPYDRGTLNVRFRQAIPVWFHRVMEKLFV